MFSKEMKILTKTILTILTGMMINGCMRPVDINEYIDTSRPIDLIINDGKDSVSILNIPKIKLTNTDERFKKLMIWGRENLDNWNWTPVSYVMADACLIQGEFRLRYYSSGFVVVEFKDKKGKQRQIKKDIKKEDLSFLLK
jgi:hypothetical protein